MSLTPATPRERGRHQIGRPPRVDRRSRGSTRRPSGGEPPRGTEIFRSRRFSPNIELRLRALAGASTWHGLAAAFIDWSLIGLAALVIVWAVHTGPLAYWLLVPAWILIGARMRALATLLHEASHKVLAKTRWLNVVLGTIGSGWWVLQTLTRYTGSHVREHHPNLNQPERDPDAQPALRQRLLEQDPDWIVIRNLVLALLGAKTAVNLPYVLSDRLLPRVGATLTPAERIELILFCVTWAMVLGALIASHTIGWFVLIWVVPYFTTFQAINWLIELTEHFPLQWTRGNSFERTRNRKGPAWEQFLFGAHGEGLHRTHHERRYIPFYALAKAHAIMMEDADYQAFEAESGGIFVRGPTGAPTILSVIAAETRRYQLQIQEIQW